MGIFKFKQKKQREKLENAIKQVEVETVKDILAGGLDPNYYLKNEFGFSTTSATLLADTCTRVTDDNAPIEIVEALLSSGADPNIGDTRNGYTPLMWAASRGNVELTHLLLRKGAIPNRKSKIGNTALSDAQARGHTEVVKVLVKYGAKA